VKKQIRVANKQDSLMNEGFQIGAKREEWVWLLRLSRRSYGGRKLPTEGEYDNAS
jgi:hypothetical protein